MKWHYIHCRRYSRQINITANHFANHVAVFFRNYKNVTFTKLNQHIRVYLCSLNFYV